MGVVIGLVIVAVVVYVGVCAMAGMGRFGGSLAAFPGGIGPIERRFASSAAATLDAYREASARTPGMSMVEQHADALLLDLRPTSRILGGSFGLGIRVVVRPSESGGSTVRVDATKKVGFALGTADGAALVHAERALRMNAKRAGISEVI